MTIAALVCSSCKCTDDRACMLMRAGEVIATCKWLQTYPKPICSACRDLPRRGQQATLPGLGRQTILPAITGAPVARWVRHKRPRAHVADGLQRKVRP